MKLTDMKKSLFRVSLGALLTAGMLTFGSTGVQAEGLTENPIVWMEEMDSCASASYTIPYTTYDEVVAKFRQGMVNRETSITITGVPEDFDKYYELLDDAMAYSDNCSSVEGDALSLNVLGCQISGHFYMNDIAYVYSLGYRTTAEQEATVSAYVKNALASLKLNGKDDYTKLKLIHDYVCDHVDYDHEGLAAEEAGNEDPMIYTAYNAAVKGKAVCQGYAILFYEMAKEAGFSCRIITGASAMTGERHAWNIVRLGEFYYAVDTTWDGDEETIDTYFLLGELEHTVVDYDYKYLTNDFRAEFPMAYYRYGHTFEKLQIAAPDFYYYDKDGNLKSSKVTGKAKIIAFFGNTCFNSKAFIRSISTIKDSGYDVDVLAVEEKAQPKRN